MTENKALELMESLVIDPKCELVKTLDFKATVIKALEDLQQYRAIGTVDEVAEMSNSYINYFHKVRQYEAIGTINELQELKEKSFFNTDSSVVDVDKKSYDWAIDEFAEVICNNIAEDSFRVMLPDGFRADVITVDYVQETIMKIAEEMRGAE